MIQVKGVEMLEEPEESWTQRVQDEFLYEPMNGMTESRLKSRIQMIDQDDLRNGMDNEDRTTAKFFCYQLLAQIQFKHELPSVIAQYGAIEGRRRLKSIFKQNHPFLDTDTI